MRRRVFRNRVIAVCGLVLLSLSFVGIWVWHFGPLGTAKGEKVLCARLSVTNGSQFLVVAERTGEAIDAYHTFLYRIPGDGSVYRYALGYEDSFWWGCSLKQSETPGDINIIDFGRTVARYRKMNDEIIWITGEYPSERGMSVSTAEIKMFLSETKPSNDL
jgi:hypothetical protein